MHAHRIYDIVAGTVTGCAFLYGALPPWEQFNDYPKFQNAYRFVMIFVFKIGSLNVRSLLSPQIQATSNKGGTDSK